MRLRGICMTAAALVAVGCAGIQIGGGDDDEVRQTVVIEDASYDAAWAAILQTFAELELPISTLEKESGLVATDWILVEDPDELMDCDDGYRNAEMRFNVFLSTVAGGQEMTITSSSRATDESGALERCVSTGQHERSIQVRVGRKVG